MKTATLPRLASRPLRVDAARNRGLVVKAAYEVFAERGLDARVEEVATRAGVGKATVYRNFETKEQLIAAVACAQLSWFEQLAEEAARSPDAWAAFTRLMDRAAEAQASNRAVAGSLDARNETTEIREARAAAAAALDRLMERAKRQGAMRSDATSRDVWVLFGGVGKALTDSEQGDPAVWRRYACLIAEGLRAPGRPVPGPPSAVVEVGVDGEEI